MTGRSPVHLHPAGQRPESLNSVRDGGVGLLRRRNHTAQQPLANRG